LPRAAENVAIGHPFAERAPEYRKLKTIAVMVDEEVDLMDEEMQSA
jgi:hypothetical protein